MEINEASFQDIRYSVVEKVWLFIVPCMVIERYEKDGTTQYSVNSQIWSRSLAGFQHIANNQLTFINNIHHSITVMDVNNTSIFQDFTLGELMKMIPYQLLDLMY